MYIWTCAACIIIFLICLELSFHSAAEIYQIDHYKTKISNFREGADIVQRRIKALQAQEEAELNWKFASYAVKNNWPGIE